MLINGKKRCAKCMNILNNDEMVCKCGANNATLANDMHCLQIGTVLDDTYVVGRVIGEGGFGITYVGWDKNIDIKVAIKEFYLNGFSSRYSEDSSEIIASAGEGEELFERNRDKFINEAKILASLSDEPGIVSVYKFFRENNTAYIAMEFVEGVTLKEKLKAAGTFSVDETIGIIGPIMNSLAKIHKQNLIHRDISPDNIMITADGRGKLIDFGAAREANEGNKSLSVVLKHGYAPMEQYQTRGNQGPWTDVYALAATIYKCITGIIPPEATDRVMSDGFVPMHQIRPECNVAVSHVITKALSIKIQERYQTVGEFKDALLLALNTGEFYEDKTVADTTGKIPENKTVADTASKTPENKTELKTERKKSTKLILVIAASLAGVAVILLLFLSLLGNKKNDVVAENTVTDGVNESGNSDGEDVKAADEGGAIDDTSKPLPDLAAVKVGDIITLGQYEQDNNPDNGMEDIDWVVLEKQDEKALLISRYALDAIQYYVGSPELDRSWEMSNIREWLNNTFMGEAFSDSEKDIIICDTVRAEVNPKYPETSPGNDVEDYIFVLSADQAAKYFSTDEERQCEATEYAKAQGVWTDSNYGDNAAWWLRNPGIAAYDSMDVNLNGSINYNAHSGEYTTTGVRPAMWVRTQ